jgi:peptidyl-prolyl cis-trans isomerase D
MLQNIRDNVQGLVAKIIIGLIVVPFAIFGIESLVGGGGPVEVAKVNGEKIEEAELAQAINVQRRQLLARMGDNVQPALLDEAALRGPALDGLITQHLLKQNAEALKLRLPAQSVDQTILSMAAFQDNGKFSPERYEMLLRNQGYSTAYFKQLMQQELLINQLHSAFVGSDFVTPAELKTVAGLLQQQRSFRYVTIPVAGLADKVNISDAEIATYYKEHSDQFLSEERVKLEYIALHAEDYFQPVDDAAIKTEYDREMADFKPSTERHAAHILIEANKQRDDAEAQALVATVAKKLAAGEDFAKLAAQYSDDIGSKTSGGDLGVSSGDAFPPQFEAALSKLGVGEISAPVKSESGYHLIKLLEQHTRERPTLEQRKAEIAQRLQQSGAHPELIKNVEKLRDLVFNSEGLAGPAKELKATIRESDWIDRKSTDPLLGDPKVIAAAFSQEVVKENNNSDVLELSPDRYVVLRMKEHQPATPKPLDEVKAGIVAALKQQRAIDEVKSIADQLIKQIKQGDDLEKLASQRGYAIKTVEKSARNNGAVNPELLRGAFSLPKTASGTAASANMLELSNGDVAVLQLQVVIDGVPDSLNPGQRDALLAQLQQSFGTAGFAAFMEDTRARAEIKRRSLVD